MGDLKKEINEELANILKNPDPTTKLDEKQLELMFLISLLEETN